MLALQAGGSAWASHSHHWPLLSTPHAQRPMFWGVAGVPFAVHGARSFLGGPRGSMGGSWGGASIVRRVAPGGGARRYGPRHLLSAPLQGMILLM